MPGLDGLRGVAVLALLISNLHTGWMPGGQLALALFLAISGYLVTDLLLSQIASGGIDFRRYWLHRVTRLFPPLAVVVAVTAAWVAIVGPDQTQEFRAAVATALAGVNNWWLAFDGSSFLSQIGGSDPLGQVWPASVLWQYCLVWPFLLLVALRLRPDATRPSGARPALSMLLALLALASAVLAYVSFKAGVDFPRIYYGTSTWLAPLSAGAALASARPSVNLRPGLPARGRAALDVVGLLGLLGFLAVAFGGSLSPGFVFGGGLVAASLAAVMLISAAAHPASRFSSFFGASALPWLGVRSYGLFLWSVPVIALSGGAGGSTLRSLMQLVVTLGIAGLSWRYVERPFRDGSALLAFRDVGQGVWRPTRASQAVLAIAGVVVGSAAVGIVGATAAPPEPVTLVETTMDRGVHFAEATSCGEVTHIGDSTSAGLVSGDLPKAEQLDAQYRTVGIQTRHLDIADRVTSSGDPAGTASAEDKIRSWQAQSHDGCVVLAIGNDDVASLDSASPEEIAARIDSVMNTTGGERVLWVNLKSELTSGPLADERLQRWNAGLAEACNRYPNMRVFDWAGAAQDDWFATDGVHFTQDGYRARGTLIADAVGEAFPPGGSAPKAGDSCVVSSSPRTVKEATASPTPISIAWAGDITPGSQYGLPPDHAKSMFENVRSYVRAADLAIGNLEGTLSTGGASKCGTDSSTCFSFQAPPENAIGLRWAGFDLFNLGNNHALDYGDEGQRQTIAALNDQHLRHTGLPNEITLTQVNGTRVAVIGFAPYEWSNSVADLDQAARLIRTAGEYADAVVVIGHLGAEGADQGHTPTGTEYAFGEDRGDTRAFAHAAIDAGASLVLGSGPHVLRGMEHYKDGLIAYSLGNFAGWDNFSTDGVLGESALLHVDLSRSGQPTAGQITPLRLTGPGVPSEDPAGGAIATMNSLSDEDFGVDGVKLGPSGDFSLTP